MFIQQRLQSSENIFSIANNLLLSLLYKAEKPSVCLSVRPSDRHADISAVYASIETRLARNES